MKLKEKLNAFWQGFKDSMNFHYFIFNPGYMTKEEWQEKRKKKDVD